MTPAARPIAFPPAHDPQLWQLAKRRAKFQRHLLVYLLINAGLWVLYGLLPESHEAGELPWPLWTGLFWGLGLAIQGLCVYAGLGRRLTQREYERLLSQQPL